MPNLGPVPCMWCGTLTRDRDGECATCRAKGVADAWNLREEAAERELDWRASA